MQRSKTTKDEALKALHEASLSIACLGADWTEHFEDESVIKNHRKWVLKDQEGLQKDLDHIQDQITILENFLNPDSTYNPYAPKKTLNEIR
tara:strand:- start:1275 stop:1547 length:273 start_codon:yes stop_codon:yes gene_type:complete